MRKNTIVKTAVVLFGAITTPAIALAHCPLCTAGTGALAVLASSIGMSTAGVGVFVGAASLALGIWLARVIKKKYVRHQDILLAGAIFLLTALPVLPLIREYRALYIAFWGEYGTLLHNTYLINLYLAGVFAGALIMFVSPSISRFLIRARKGRAFPFQGLTITFGLLIVAALLFQLIL